MTFGIGSHGNFGSWQTVNSETGLAMIMALGDRAASDWRQVIISTLGDTNAYKSGQALN